MGGQAPQTDKPILVTGATGYISSYIIEELLAEGYKVRGTVRSLQNKDKYAHLEKLKCHDNLSFVQAELGNEECWDAAVQGCDYVVHVASPIPPYVPKDEDEVIKPAVAGAKNVLRASIKNNVKRFVFTSSCLTLYFGNDDKLLDEGLWADPAKCAHYPKSKILAEKAIWQIYNEQNLQQHHTEVVSVLPSLVLGPGLTTHGNSSEALVAEILKGNFPGIPDPDVMYTVVDVRDAAHGHCLALFKPNLDGQRVAVAAGKMYLSEIINILQKQYSNSNIKVDKINAQEIKASGNPIAQRSLPFMGKRFEVNNEKSIEKLGIQYRPLQQTILDMAKQLKKLGIVPS